MIIAGLNECQKQRISAAHQLLMQGSQDQMIDRWTTILKKENKMQEILQLSNACLSVVNSASSDIYKGIHMYSYSWNSKVHHQNTRDSPCQQEVWYESSSDPT